MKSGPGALERASSFVRDQLARTVVAYVVLAVALLLTGLAYYYVRQNVEARERARFEEITQATELAVDRRMNTYIDAMLDGRGLFAASESVTREEWREYVAGSDLKRRYPGIRAIAYAERVPLEEREAYVRRIREEGFSSYTLRPAGERFEYFPLTYVEPFEGANRSLLGYDFYSDRVNRDAMEQARDTGLPRASGKVDLERIGISRQTGFLVYTPLYRDGAPQETPDERRKALQGFIVSVFRTDDLLEGIFGGQADPQVELEVFDGAEFTREGLLHDDDGTLHAGNPSYSAHFSKITTLEVAGRIWSLYFGTLPGFEPGWRSNLPLFVLASGLAMSLMLFAITWMLVHSRIQAEHVGLQLETANKELENANRDLEGANRELEAANTELEAFSYSVSHDLRAPLRSIEGFSQILLEDYSDSLQEEAKSYLSRLRGASRRMALLIDDLLELSRVTRTTLRPQKSVNLSKLAREIAQEIQKSDPAREVEFVISEGLMADADGRLLAIALENLLSNAFKFTSKRRVGARIEFGAISLQEEEEEEEEEGEGAGGGSSSRGSREEGLEGKEERLAYYVKDNGVGFEMAYATKLFGPFQRLHGADEFEGTGIGLATVARIVRRHGGRVWAVGEVGVGATFFFTLGGRRQGS
jgi:signal transduction histidine kinase